MLQNHALLKAIYKSFGFVLMNKLQKKEKEKRKSNIYSEFALLFF